MIKIGTRSYSQAPVDTRGVNGYGLPQLAETSLRACCFYGPPNSPGTFRAVTGKPDHYRFPADCLKSLLFPHNSENQTPLDPAELIKSLLAQNQQAGAKGLHISFVHSRSSHDCEVHLLVRDICDIRSRMRFTTQDSACPDHVLLH